MAQKKLMESTLPEIFVKCVDEDADMIIRVRYFSNDSHDLARTNIDCSY